MFFKALNDLPPGISISFPQVTALCQLPLRVLCYSPSPRLCTFCSCCQESLILSFTWKMPTCLFCSQLEGCFLRKPSLSSLILQSAEVRLPCYLLSKYPKDCVMYNQIISFSFNGCPLYLNKLQVNTAGSSVLFIPSSQYVAYVEE